MSSDTFPRRLPPPPPPPPRCPAQPPSMPRLRFPRPLTPLSPYPPIPFPPIALPLLPLPPPPLTPPHPPPKVLSWRVMIVPVLRTTGVNTKILVALELGVPLVITPVAASPFDFPEEK